MIRITKNEVKTRQVETKYPCLMKGKLSGAIYIVVGKDDSKYKAYAVGSSSDFGFYPCENLIMIDYPITLENELCNC